MKARNVLWPVMIMSALSLAGACGTDDGGGGGDPVGGSDSTGDGGTSTGATNSAGGTKQTGGMSTSDGGEPPGAAGMVGAGGAGIDLCADLDLNCEDDDDPCTEDECNPATGECGIPRSGTSCDDGVFCNGDDSCDEGACTEHEGNPCGDQDCNEAGNYCECETKEDCDEDTAEDWSPCDYGDGDTCVETGKRTRLETVYACTEGKCVSSTKLGVDTVGCDRETEMNDCLDDGNRCTGVEKCKTGACTSSGINPCASNEAKPYCYKDGVQCRQCTASHYSGTPNAGCDDGQYCCGGVCGSSKCGIIVTTNTSFASAATKFEP